MAKKEQTAIAPHTSGGGLEPAPDYIPKGQDGIDTGGEVLWPRARIVQRTSDALTAGAKLGQILDEVTGEVLSEAGSVTRVTPIGVFYSWIQWGPKMGDGVVNASNDPKSALAQSSRAGKKRADGKREVTNYINFVMMFHDVLDSDDRPRFYVVPFYKSGFKTGRKLLMLAKARNRPLYSGVYLLGTKDVNKGERKWYEPVIDNDGFVSKEEFEVIQKIHVAAFNDTVKTLKAEDYVRPGDAASEEEPAGDGADAGDGKPTEY